MHIRADIGRVRKCWVVYASCTGSQAIVRRRCAKRLSFFAAKKSMLWVRNPEVAQRFRLNCAVSPLNTFLPALIFGLATERKVVPQGRFDPDR